MNYSPHPIDHLIFLSVLMINYVGIKVAVAGFTDFLELLFVIPLKVLPFLTAYLAYRKQIHDTFQDFKQWIRRKKK